MTTPKEPQWSPAEIPGLIRKRGGRKPELVTDTAVPTAPAQSEESPPPVHAATAAPEKESQIATSNVIAREALKGAVAFAGEVPVTLSPVEAHEELMDCLVNAQALVQKIRAAADSYYIMCDYLAGEGDQYIPVVDSIMRALKSKDPTLIAELIETQANEIVDGWQILQGTATKAVDICKLLTQASRAQIIDDELKAAE